MKGFLATAMFFVGAPLGSGAAEQPQTILRYEVVAEGAPDAANADLDKLIAALDRRLNPGGWRRLFREYPIRKLDSGQIEIVVRGDDPERVRRIERLVESAGTLEFRILANDRDHKELIELARKEKSDQLRDQQGNLLAWWVPLYLGHTPQDREWVELSIKGAQTATRVVKNDGRDVGEVLVVNDEFNVTDADLTQARADMDARGKPCISFRLGAAGGKRFAGLTGTNLPDKAQDFHRCLGIILDGKLYSAPRIRATVRDGGQIWGSFTKTEMEDLVNVLNAGTLPVKVRKVAPSKPEAKQ